MKLKFLNLDYFNSNRKIAYKLVKNSLGFKYKVNSLNNKIKQEGRELALLGSIPLSMVASTLVTGGFAYQIPTPLYIGMACTTGALTAATSVGMKTPISKQAKKIKQLRNEKKELVKEMKEIARDREELVKLCYVKKRR